MSLWWALPWAVGLLLTTTGSASAQREITDLKVLSSGQQVTALSYCRGVWEVGSQGPDATTPALVPTGRVGDRAFVVFAGLDELKAALKKEC